MTIKKLIIILSLFPILCINNILNAKDIDLNELQFRKDYRYYEINSETPFTGIAYKYFSNGNVEEKIIVENGKEIEATTWYENQNKKRYFKEINDKTAHIQSWYENKQPRSDEFRIYINDERLSGTSKAWYENGNLKLDYKVNHNNGEILSETHWYSNGQKKIDYNIVDGQTATFGHSSWAEDGSIISENKANIETIYYENGLVKTERTFKKNLLDGKFSSYDENGNLLSEYLYKEGKLNGISKTYFKTKQLKSEYLYKEGKLNGISKTYFKTKQLKSEIEYKNFKPLGIYFEWDENGNKISDFIINESSIVFSIVNKSSKLSYIYSSSQCFNNIEEIISIKLKNNDEILENKDIEIFYYGILPPKRIHEVKKISLYKKFPIDYDYNVFKDQKNRSEIIKNSDLFSNSFSQAETEHIISHKDLREAKISINNNKLNLTFAKKLLEQKQLINTMYVNISFVDYPYQNDNSFLYYTNKLFAYIIGNQNLDFLPNKYLGELKFSWESKIPLVDILKKQHEVCQISKQSLDPEYDSSFGQPGSPEYPLMQDLGTIFPPIVPSLLQLK